MDDSENDIADHEQQIQKLNLATKAKSDLTPDFTNEVQTLVHGMKRSNFRSKDSLDFD